MQVDVAELAVARAAARAGGDIVTRYFREGVTMRAKRKCDLVSDADVNSEQAIVARIRQAFPQHTVLGEELHQGDVAAKHLWVVDPLDGTTNFAHSLSHFAISIAYYLDGEPQVGVVYNPLRDQWYEAVRGAGAYLNGERVQVNASAEMGDQLIGVGFYYDRGAMMESTLAAIRELFQREIHGIRRFGTASLDLCMVGCGHFGAFFEYELSPWDYAAARLFVEEAGGRVTTCDGAPLPLRVTTLLASNGLLHDTMLAIVSRHM